MPRLIKREQLRVVSSLYVFMAIKHIIVLFVELILINFNLICLFVKLRVVCMRVDES